MTFGVALAGKMEWVKAIWYWVAQIVGAVLAAFVLLFVLPVPGSLGATTLASGVSPIQGVVIEVILTVFLVLSVMNPAYWERTATCLAWR